MDITAQTNGQVGIFTSDNKRVRVIYRTNMTADDDFNRAFMENQFISEDGKTITVDPKVLARFCLETFCTKVELLDESGKVERIIEPFTWDSLQSITGIHAEGGWTVMASLDINRKVLRKSIEEAEEVKKALPPPSNPGSLDGGPEKTPPVAATT